MRQAISAARSSSVSHGADEQLPLTRWPARGGDRGDQLAAAMLGSGAAAPPASITGDLGDRLAAEMRKPN